MLTVSQSTWLVILKTYGMQRRVPGKAMHVIGGHAARSRVVCNVKQLTLHASLSRCSTISLKASHSPVCIS